MRTIWKYPLEVQDEIELEMPRGAEVLSVQAYTETGLEMWALVDTEAPKESRRFHVRGTGHALEGVGAYLATARAGRFVWHVFEGVA